MRYFTHETFEAPDADGSCCHLRETGLGELCDADEARETERQLKEAAALLARVKTGDQQFASDIDQWFSRVAPQPEPTQASSEAGAKYFDWDRTPAQPAAPAAEQAFEDGLDGSDWTKPPRPAAPEPSELQKRLDATNAMRERAESAEARITAVQGQIETAVAQRLEAAVMSALRYEREESHSNTTRRALVIESRMDEALELLESAARIVENDDWRDRYDVLRGFIASDPAAAQKPALRPEFIALGKALCEPLTPVTPAPRPAAPTAGLYDVFMSGVRKPAAPEPNGVLDRLFGALPDLPNPSLYEETLDESRAWQARAESAEAQLDKYATAPGAAKAQLEAVRTIATDMVAQLQKVGYLPAKTRVMRYEGFIEALMRGFVDIAALLTAPSPGEGEETL